MKKVLIVILVLVVLVGLAIGGAYVYTKYFEKKEVAGEEEVKEEPIVIEEKKVKTFAGTDRPIAVMIDNHKDALPHSGLSKAYMVYEIIVEGGESRLMALFKGADLEKIGPVRSSRHYFLDYALENDALYVHFGWSPQAQSDISSLGVNNINGLTDDAGFWRVKDKQAPHNAMTSTERIMKVAEEKDYRTTSDTESILKYSVDEINLEESAEAADEITIPYSPSNSVRWEYDADSKEYVRYTKGKKEIEQDTQESVTAKNIIIEFIENSTISGDTSGRQNLKTTGNHDGYYITNGKAIKINCSKTSRKSKTEYTDLDGNVIKVNDGNTFMQLCPINAKVVIEGNEESE